jgi:hypothetical protein
LNQNYEYIMSNYLAQIAARSVVSDQLLLTPAHSTGDMVLDDPFDASPFAARETTEGIGDVRSATNMQPAVSGNVLNPAPPRKENTPDADATATAEVKPVYLSKYIARNQYYARENSHKDIPVNQISNHPAPLALEQKASPVLPERTDLPAKTELISQATSKEKISSVQQQEWPEKKTSSDLKSVLPKSIERKQEQPAVLLPVANAKRANSEPVLLKPQLPSQPHKQPQKEKPVPSLVIGKITVEIIPAQKPVNKIINHVIKSQPATSVTAQRSKNSFGLGQL